MSSSLSWAMRQPLDPNFMKMFGPPRPANPAVAQAAIREAEERSQEPASNDDQETMSKQRKEDRTPRRGQR
ncbi:hypothetical protein F66182_2736 [Fusarium sp. NRRL 66182]|nr:hypothetical protein F66182_2736 [Fusarium sp. NRRL 66182]